MAVPLVAWIIAALAGSATVKIAQPRLPVYNIQINSIPRPWWVDGQIKTILPTRITLSNENYIPINIHALQFDLYYTSVFDGNMYSFGSIQDHNTLFGSPSKKDTNSTKAPPVWKMKARADFDYSDKMVLGITSYTNLLSAVASLVRYVWNLSGSIILPCTGVAHVFARGVPATVSLVCDNLVNGLWVQGRECTIHGVQPGWGQIDSIARDLRQFVEEKKAGSTLTGGLFLQELSVDGLPVTERQKQHQQA